MATILPNLIPQTGLELCIFPHYDGLSIDDEYSFFTDYSIYNRHLLAQGASGARPVCKASTLASHNVARFDGSADREMKNATALNLKAGFMVVKTNNASFSEYMGLLSGPTDYCVLCTQNTGTLMYDFMYEDTFRFEYRYNERIYSAADTYPAPANEWALIYFRFWEPLPLSNGVQIGRDRNFTSRLFNGDVAFCALYSVGFCESDVQETSALIADTFGLTLENVFPFIADRSSEFLATKIANVYDPPEGDRVTEIIQAEKIQGSLTFSSRKNSELKTAKEVWADNFPDQKIIYRNYNTIPPTDIVCYINSPIRYGGATNLTQYEFSIKEA